jgi:hypothetical protein
MRPRLTAVDLASRWRETAGRHPLAPALAMLVASVAMLLGLAVRLPSADAQVALVFPPGISRAQAMAGLAGLDARIVRAGGFGNIVIAHFDRPASWGELRRLGVLLSLDPIVAGGCVPDISTRRDSRLPVLAESHST